MATFFDWAKLGLDNSKIIYSIMLLLLSATGFSTCSVYEKDEELEITRNQVSEVASYYVNTRELKPEPVVESDCGSCQKLLIKHKREFHE